MDEDEVCLLRTGSTLSVSPEYIMSIANFPAQYILVEIHLIIARRALHASFLLAGLLRSYDFE
jgi:hypothetical protein